MQTSKGLKVQRRNGQLFHKSLVDLGVLDRGKKIRADEDHVYLPISQIDDSLIEKLKDIADCELVEAEFQPAVIKPAPEDLLGFKPSFEIIGDIAIIGEKEDEKTAEALMLTYKSLRAIIAPMSDVEGEFRTRRFRFIAGEHRTVTTHKEHGLRYRVDLEGAYFTPRLGTERLRVARQISPSDTVLDMFAGVGPFAILMAKTGARVVAIDKNPIAVKYMRENAIINKIDKIEILEGDAAEFALRYENQADHIIMNLPHSASQFLPSAMHAAKSGGIIHYYAITPEEDLYKDLELIESAAAKLGFNVRVQYKGEVRSYAPRRYNIVIDFEVNKN